MPVDDAIRWNERYKNPHGNGWATEPRKFLIDHLDLLPREGLALDLAMGIGVNAGVLIEQGLVVVGVDIAAAAVTRARQAFPQLQAVVADLEHFALAERSFDLIIDLYYLQRDWVRNFATLLKPGGTVLMETLTRDMQSLRPEIPAAYLLEKGELLSLFTGWDVRAYREGWFPARNGKWKAVAGIVARLPKE